MFSSVASRSAAAMLVAFACRGLAQTKVPPPIVGQWDLSVRGPRGPYASWLEVTPSGFTTLVGRFVGRIGGVRPIGRVEWSEGMVRFGIPPQWERAAAELRLEGRLQADSLTGTIVSPDGIITTFTGRRAPSLRRPMPVSWGPPVSLFNGRDLSGWTSLGSGKNYWTVRDEILVNDSSEGANLFTLQKFQDFKLHLEFRHPKRGDSGVFLRGRYEVQIGDDDERDWPRASTSGSVYSFLTPNENASTGSDLWQTFDITLVGRRVTVVLNGKTVIADQIIPGLSGSALDSDEAAPGPIMLQGEETQVEYRNITISVPAERLSRGEVGVRQLSCAPNDSAAVSAVRARLAEWVRQANVGDRDGMREVWAPGYVGWFPTASIFGDSAAYAVASRPFKMTSQNARTSYDIVIDEIVASGSVVVVHDLWTEKRDFPQSKTTIKREIRGSELWRCQPDGRWRISRFVSAPEPWTLSK